MEAWFSEYILGSGFMPHGHCFMWTPGLVWQMVIADLAIATAYYSIPALLLVLYRRGHNLPEPRLLVLFAMFIFLCGTTHVVAVWNIWFNAYWVEAAVKVATALISVFTAWNLRPAIFRLLALPTHRDLALRNEALLREIARTEEAHRTAAANETRYRQLVETAAEGIWTLDTQGATTFANRRMEEMLGYGPDELNGRSLLEFIPPEDESQTRLNMARRVAGESEKHMANFLHRAGHIVHALVSASPIHEQGKVVGMLGVVTDLTEQVEIEKKLRALTIELESRVATRTAELKRTNEELQKEVEERRETTNRLAEREARLSAILNSTVDAIVVINERGIMESVNPATCTMFGYSEEQLVGRNVAMLADAPDREVHDQYLTRYLRTREARVIGLGREVTGIRRNGERMTVSLSVSETMVDGKRRFVGILHDISQLRRDADNIRQLNNSLQEANERLQAEIAVREMSQHELQQLNTRLEEALESMRGQTAHYRLLQEMSEMLQSCRTHGEAAAVIGQFASRLFSADSGTVYLSDDNARHLEATYRWGEDTESPDVIRHDDCWAVRHGRPYPLSALQQQLRCKHLHLPTERHSLCLPLYALGHHLGTISLRRGQVFFDSDEAAQDESFQLKLGFLHHAALAIASITSTQQLEYRSTRDSLTGLFNRRYLEEHLYLETARAQRSDSSLSVLMIDIDHFKRVNDNFGHQVGDQALTLVANTLARMARASDAVGRWGGEEFLVVLPGTHTQAALERAEQIREEIAAQAPVAGTEDTRLTVSIGIASLGKQLTTPEAVTAAADTALYDAKQSGRNRCAVAARK